jgi:hypothetical protein
VVVNPFDKLNKRLMKEMSKNKCFEKSQITVETFLEGPKITSRIGCVICRHPICYLVQNKRRSINDHPFAEDIIFLCQEHYEKWSKGAHKFLSTQKMLQNSNISLKDNENDLPFQIKAFETVSIRMGQFLQSCSCDSLKERLKPLLTIDEITVLGLNVLDAQLLITLLLFDKYNNRLLIVRNSLIEYASPDIRILFLKNMLTILQNNEVIFSMHYYYPNKIELKAVKLMLNGVCISVKNNLIFINENQVKSLDKKSGIDFSFIHIGACDKKTAQQSLSS